MKKEQTLKQKVADLIARHMICYSEQDCAQILVGLNVISSFNLNIDHPQASINLNLFQESLAKINEKELRRRDEGVYYTPKDATEYVVANTYLNYVCPDNVQVHPVDKCLQILTQINSSKLVCAKVFDPTCGTAEFLLSAINLKLQIIDCDSDDAILNLVSTIYGNDIAEESIFLSKVRLFFAVVKFLQDKNNSVRLAKILNKNFTSLDYIINHNISPKYDIIVGNPPYVEYRKLPVKPTTNYGNTYADVLLNSINAAKQNGALGFVIPISFVSTGRMKAIREYSYSKLSKMFLLNFADRPDCLFDGVHQKLTIFFGIKGRNKCCVYSSSYYHWYSEERDYLLSNASVLPVIPYEKYIPKIGNDFERSIFDKIMSAKGLTLADITSDTKSNTLLYLNMRGCFWMKAFSFNPGSNEYKQFKSPKEMQPYILAILNSNLYFLYWTIVSDCWHITGKEISEFIIPIKDVNFKAFRNIYNNIEKKLEETKKYIGSKQTAYEYKHKDCKPEIDAVDDALKGIYNLSDDEVEYLRNYKVKYRTSNG
ncbi:MAG: N-6 DNA methylase [Bacteroidales bacterium]|nr:N-6 DNA methylase [Bacteroidales bacterium]